MFYFKSLALLATCFVVLASSAVAGPGSTGGGFYTKIEGKWVLLDDVENGTILDPSDFAERIVFEKVEAVLVQIDARVPQFADDLRAALSDKTWHLIPYELNCEDPQAIVRLPVSAGACQDENDVWIEESKYRSKGADQLILHELIQAVRLGLNKSRSGDRMIPPSAVRALKRILTQPKFPSEEDLLKGLNKYGFDGYSGSEAYADERQREAIINEHSRKADELRNRCFANFITGKSKSNSSPEEISAVLDDVFQSVSQMDDLLGELTSLRFDPQIDSSQEAHVYFVSDSLRSSKRACFASLNAYLTR